ncbi:hypothetical protein ACIPQA_18250 [Streptomyces sp. NPDC090109]|nr:hypothetical protein [Streptomyces sp. S1]
MTTSPPARLARTTAVLRPNGAVGASGTGSTRIARSGPVLAFPPWG